MHFYSRGSIEFQMSFNDCECKLDILHQINPLQDILVNNQQLLNQLESEFKLVMNGLKELNDLKISMESQFEISSNSDDLENYITEFTQLLEEGNFEAIQYLQKLSPYTEACCKKEFSQLQQQVMSFEFNQGLKTLKNIRHKIN